LNTQQNNHIVNEKQNELENLIQHQRHEIHRLNDQITRVENNNSRSASANGNRSRPTSGQLPPITSTLTAH
ncbi:unnamed protein product, partial [Adineta steineri]